MFQSDSVCALSHLNDFRGMQSEPMDKLARNTWGWCIQRKIFVSGVYSPGMQNTVADFYFRNFSRSTEWMLKPVLFNLVCNHFFAPEIDLFASGLNKVLPDFVS